ncbi:hypothetical protein Tco_0736616 [Tanacetum coccineum]
MRILSVVSIKAYSCYEYDYLKEITLRRVDYQEYTIAEKDFKNLYPSDFEDLNLLLLQGYLNHLPGSEKHAFYWCFEYKHDYTIIKTPRAVLFPVINNERKIMRFNEIYKFSNGTLTNILEALDYRVKEYKVNQFNLVDIEKVAVRSSLRSLKPKRTIESRTKRSSINLIRTLPHNIRVIPKYHSEDGNPARANIKQALGRYEHVGPQDTRPQDGERSQDDDQRLDLADDLKKAQDHISSTNTSHMTKITTSMYHISPEESKRLRAERKINQKIAELKLVPSCFAIFDL